MIRRKTFLVLFFCLCVKVLAQGSTTSETCIYEDLPLQLNTLSYLNLNGEFHIQGEYHVDVTNIYQFIYFNLTQESTFRVYLAPHQIDVDLWLYNATSGSSIAYSSLDIGTEEVIAKTLPQGSYQLKLNYFGYWIGHYVATECDTVLMELQIVPKTLALSRINSILCPSQEIYPQLNIDPSLLDVDGSISFSSDINQTGLLLNAQSTPSAFKSTVRWLWNYTLVLPDIKDHSGAWWVLEVELGFEFLYGDSLGLMIEDSSLLPSLGCFQSNNCTLGTNSIMNSNKLKTILTPGTFTLYIYEKTGEKDSVLPNCAPFSFDFKLSLERSRENPVTCEALPLPTSLIPGLYDNPPGYLYYRDEPLMELEKGNRVITFTVAQNSLFRAYTAPHRVDIDMKLTNLITGVDIEYAYSWGGEEAIASYLTPANYSLTIIYFGTYETQFCETFDVEIAVAPLNLLNFTYCYNGDGTPKQSTFPDLSGMPDALLDPAHNYSFPLQAFFFNYGANYNDRKIYTQNFTLSQASYVKIGLGDNFLTSDMTIYLYTVSEDSEFYYQPFHHRNLDHIMTTLQPGSYSLVIQTGPVQKMTLSHFPICSQYTLQLDIKPTNVDWHCWDNARLPGDLNAISYLGNGNVVHFADEFIVPLSGSQWTTSEAVKFTVTTDSFFRFGPNLMKSILISISMNLEKLPVLLQLLL